MDLSKELISKVESLKNSKKAEINQRFFKTNKGEYGEGDFFLGLTVPECRLIAKNYFKKIKLIESEKLLENKFHEIRLIGLLILVKKYEEGDLKTKKEICDFYLKNTEKINNWDLVDLTAHKILGDWIKDKNKNILYELAKSNNLWERRISVVANFVFIKNKDFKDAIKISEFHLKDNHDLMHKAVGWLLREIGKKDISELRKFLSKYHKIMPRTMLRYSIEKMSQEERKKWMQK